ncbi:pyridoxamine 5'-phosphate oxidase family protein [Pseudohoeflea coraliihabitans]|uniref:Pyridoxamine 5'-phosphate oxidase family protein n=1 Tax=Pseudohoeflea coraliihabitans TaxID=2860393 RepID=A0ABS6WQE4_9HYPH|nr:pyridoxamine 5'-phosphate oxidase family protein [Pseudohoeflea sp. DP4N28-3]MBW3098192.1 pyridoxamine 5'-phosphate oxidase family protein [Pseudohoeflea sp. DP4N28-3]
MSDKRFWEAMDDVRAAMLSIGSARHVPMSPYPEADRNRMWFIGAAGTDLVEALDAGQSDGSLIVTGADHVYARIEGRASLSSDRGKLEDLWNPVASSWFDGIDDPDIRLIEFIPSEAEIWETTNSIGFMVEMAKSKMTGDTPDMGDHYTVRF